MEYGSLFCIIWNTFQFPFGGQDCHVIVWCRRLEMKTVPLFPVICVLMAASFELAVQEETVNIGVIVDSTSWSGKIAKTAIKLAVEDVNNQSQLFNGTQMFLHLQEAQTPIETLSADLGEAANVPILSLSVTSPVLSNQRFPYFVRIARSDRVQMKAIAALVKHYGWRNIAFLHSDDDFGSGAMSALRDALRDLHSEIVYTSMMPSTSQKQTIREELYKLKSIKSSVFVVHTPSDLGINLFTEAQEIGMMEAGYVWITTHEFTSLWDYVVNASTMSSMQGLLGVKTHIPNSKQLNDFTERWERQFRLDNPNMKISELNAYGLLAYDTVLMISQAIGKMERNARLSFLKPSSSLSVLANTKIKVFQQGKKLLREIFLTNFTGLSGLVRFDEGQMYGSCYEIVNVVGKSYQIAGYWPSNSSMFLKALPPSFGNKMLRSVIWPGGFVTVPRGWVIPSKLKIAVPVTGWDQLLNVSFNPQSNETKISGFIIDVFHAVVKKLDYQLQYDLVPLYGRSDSHDANELIRQVYLKKYDAIVGDITITANRSEIVDFTQPFTETGLVIVAPTPIKDEANNAWTFLQPFSPALWATTAAFVLYTGVVVWLLEHKTNPDFRGSLITQVVTLIWFAFSAVFYAHRERIHNNLNRIVIVAWLFVALVLTSSYTANLSSRLTAQQITPLINGLGNYKLGYHGSCAGSFLRDKLGMAEKQLDQTSSPRAYEEALSKGAKNGGVDAIIDEIPYVRAFLSGRCGYSMVGRTYRNGGFGFVFYKDSSLVQDFSKGILNLQDSCELQEIEDKYFKDSTNTCSNFQEYATRLDVVSFKGLYLITGMASSLALIIFLFQALYNYTKGAMLSRQEISIWEYIKSFPMYLYHESIK
ncbi:glutamate receptor 2.9 isoform X2 [Cryptomeria japonica]|uniref:glutamate receptor 2.9 isoform X2 n=1 Tax=Cryptomeria japonica TaxID=3369 RepID=UPI0027DA8839|nr:glutamate receptor 2.9 isoform X2 [Cryptomeria japonica]